jgi:WD40 repeat protein
MRFSTDNQLLVAECVWPRRSQADPEYSRYTGELWELAAGRHLGSFTNLAPLAISADGRMIAGETFDYRAKVVNLGARSERILPVGHKDHFTACAFSPDGKLLATSSYDGDARLWDVQMDQRVHRLSGHKQGVHSVAFSPDGRTLVSGGTYGDVKFWNVATGKELFSLTIPSQRMIWTAKFSPDGRTLVLENTRHILRVPPLTEIDAAEKAR